MPRSAKKKDEPISQRHEAFLENLESIIRLADVDEGFMRGSLSNESWKIFLQSTRSEILTRLKEYGAEKMSGAGFVASNLSSYHEEKQKLQRVHLRNLVMLYNRAHKTYKSLCG